MRSVLPLAISHPLAAEFLGIRTVFAIGGLASVLLLVVFVRIVPDRDLQLTDRATIIRA